MFYGIFFLTLSILLGSLPVQYGSGVSLSAIWPAVAFLVVSVAYLGSRANLLGKRADGSVSPIHQIVLLPYFLLIQGVWHFARLCSSEPAVQEIAPGIWIGRRLLAREIPGDVQVVIDLTSEFAEPLLLRTVAYYVSIPVLDAMTPGTDQFVSGIRRVAELPGKIFIHCAQGHGRTTMFAALLLITKGFAKNADDALEQIRTVRPKARLNRHQRRFLELVKPAELR